jgi:hypothetical protein
LELGRIQEKIGKEKTQGDPIDPANPAKPGCNPLTFVFFLFFIKTMPF